MNFKQNIYEEGPLGDGWILITGGSSEISKKKNEGCKVKKASDGKSYYKCPSNTNDDDFPEGYKCVTDGEKQKANDGTFYYQKNINGVLWDFTSNGGAGKSDYPYWTNLYICEGGKPKIINVCDQDGVELKGKEGDPYEYKKIVDKNNLRRDSFCTRKQGIQKWLHLEYGNPKHKKAYDAIKKKFETEVDNNQGDDKKQEDPEISKEDPKKEENITIKYPAIAPQNIIDEFNTKYPCLSELKTMVNVNNDDGIEYYYKVEKVDEDETVFYYLSGRCIIKKTDGSAPSKKYFRCP